jgi:glycosidase
MPLILLLALLAAVDGCHSRMRGRSAVKDSIPSEVIYHVFERSFYDSNGDAVGDFNGLASKLGYLQNLGVTALLVTPIIKSVYYHNYFADDFEQTDPAYGSLEDWEHLVTSVHRRGMKIYLDVEFQYVTGKQKWLKDSYRNPKSPYRHYILYQDSRDRKPEPIIYNISTLVGYNDSSRMVATVNLANPKVRDYFFGLMKHWMDPNGDGNFQDGVDGFRLDHMMDNLDHKNILPHLFSTFWCPLITRLKAVNPKIIFIAEQANWASFGRSYFDSACVDRVFAFNLRYAIASFDKARIAAAADSTFRVTPPGKQQVVFIENHDMERFASAVGRNPGKLRVGAAFNLLIGGVPSIYYGQELGMFGKGGFGRFGNTDGNDIPQREAFEWYKADTGRGMAVWYKNTGPWWDSTNLKPDDGVSLAEEQDDPGSLFSFYKSMITLHKSDPAFTLGKYAGVANDNDSVFSFVRYTGSDAALVAINLSAAAQRATLNMRPGPVAMDPHTRLTDLFGDGDVERKDGRLSVQLPPYAVEVWKIVKPQP